MIHLYWKNLFAVPSQMICGVFSLTYPRASFSMSKAILQMRFGRGDLISEIIGAVDAIRVLNSITMEEGDNEHI